MVAKSNDQHEPSAHKWLNITRRAAIVLLVVISGLAFGTYVAVRWTEKQVLNTDNWVSLVTPLPKQPVVYNALGSYIGNKVYPADTVKTELTNALPPKASFLATPLTSQLQSITVKVAQKVVSSDAFQTVWSGANRVAMDRLLSKARGQPTALQQKLGEKFNLNLSNVTSQLGPALGSLSSVIPALQPNSQKVIDVSTNLHASAEKSGKSLEL